MPVDTWKTFGPCTLNNYTDKDIEWLKSLECSVMTCAKEIGESGTPHLQFSVTFKRSYSYAALKKLHPRISWRAQNCTQDNNYCRKIDSEVIIDVDNRKRKGARSDLIETREIVMATCSMREVAKHTTNMQAIRSSEIWLKYCEPEREIQEIEIYWHWGVTGAGKTYTVYKDNAIEDIYVPVSYKWWEGYDGHTVILLDEFRADFCKYKELLRLFDVYPQKVECKGGSRQLKAKKWYVTSCYHPKDVYETIEDKQQLLRRITKIIHFDTHYYNQKKVDR